MSTRDSTHPDDSGPHARIAALEAENAALRAQLKGHQAAAVVAGAEHDADLARAQEQASTATADRLALGTLEQANAALRLFNAELTESRAAHHAGEQCMRLILESATNFAIITTGLDGRVTGWNSGARNIFGWDEAEILGESAKVIWTSADLVAGAPEAEMRIAREQGRAADERWHLRRDGSRFWASGLMTPMRDDSGTLLGYLKILRDRTERRAVEAALRESENRFRILAESIPNFVFRSRSSGERIWGSPQWIAYSGLSEGESLGLGWLDAVHPDDRAKTMAAWTAAEASELFSVEHRTRCAADGTYRWFQSRAVPMRDEVGRVTEWFGTSTDIDDQMCAREVLARGREELEALVGERTIELAHTLDALRTEAAERARAEETLRQAQKMEAVGQLTGGIAHDFNNMLQGVAGGLETARRRITQGRADEAGRYLEMAREAVGRAAGLTRRLLAFARRQRLDPKAIDPDGLVAGIADLLRRTVGPGVKVELDLHDGTGSVLCDANELESALLNLCINARDAMPEGGRLMIGTADAELSAADIAEQEGAAPGDYVVISVTDTGEGMQPEVLERVFEPFFTTKPVGQGTGLGLSQVYGFVQQSGGLVRLESVSGRGTTVRLYLPRQERGATTGPPPAAPVPQFATGQTVLLVDDEDGVRGPAAERLRELGYQVLAVADGPAALRLLQASSRVDLLVTDVGLPNGMNGRQVAEAARERMPALPVLFITGYAGSALPDGVEVIGKPFELDALARRVQAMLRPSSSP
jgi:PAS domain S-box-containing protein